MATVTLQQIKGSPLTNTEFETNLTNINNETVDNSGVYKLRPSLDVDLVGTKSVSPYMGFSRASIGTYYDGKTVAKAEENLLKYSQDFETTWIRTNSNVVANNGTSPDGTTTADLVYPVSLTAQRSIVWQAVSAIGLTYTYSIYAKASGKNWVSFQTGSSGTVSRVFWDVLNGTLGVTNGENASIINAGNGWYRLVLTRVADGVYTTWTVCDANGLEAATANGTDGVLFWGAQTEQRAQVTAYTPTTTQPITNYVPVLQTAAANVARFDHNPITGESLGLLIEESRTNIVWPSNGTGSFGNYNGLYFSYIVVPDGSIVPCLWSAEFGISSNRYQRDIYGGTYTSGTYIVVSWFEKRIRGQGSNSCLHLTNHLNATNIVNAIKIMDVGNGWSRWYGVAQITDGSQLTYIRLYVRNGNDLVFNSFAIWGIQCETGTFPTSYIPTTSVAVTRSADTLTINKNTNWFNSVNGTLALSHDAASGQPILSEGTNTLLTSLGAGITNIDYSNSQLAVVTQSGQTVNTQGIFNFDSDLYVLGNSTSKANAHVKYLKFYPNNVIGSTPSGSGFILDDGYALLQEDNSVIFQE